MRLYSGGFRLNFVVLKEGIITVYFLNQKFKLNTMAHESRIVLGITSDLGEMFADSNQLPPGTSEADIMGFFKSMILEQESSYRLKDAELPVIKQNISDFFKDMSAQKDKLIAEEGAEAAAEIVAGAAAIAAAAGSWIPLVNFGLIAFSVAAAATAMGLEFAAKELEKSIIGDLSNSTTLISEKYPAFNGIKTYTTAVNKNTIFYPRLQVGATIKEMRSLFLGVIIMVKKSNKGVCTPELMKKAFLDYYDAVKADPELVERFIAIFEELDKTQDVDKFKAALDHLFKPLPPIVKTAISSMAVAMSAGKMIYYGKKMYSAYKAAQALGAEILDNFDELDLFGEVVEEGTASGEEALLTSAEIAGKALGILGGVASIVFGGLEIATAVDTDHKLTKAIADSKEGITKYYTALVAQTVDGITPPAGANSGNLVKGQSMGTEPLRIDFPQAFRNVNKASFTMKSSSAGASDAYYYFYNSKDVNVGIAHTKPENRQSATSSIIFDSPVEIAYMKAYSWWNPAKAVELTFTTKDRGITTENLVHDNNMSDKLNRITFPVPYQNAISASFTMANANAGASDAYYYFYNSKGVNVGTAHAKPENKQSVTGSIVFDSPVEIAYVDLYSWWNPGVAKDLKLTISENRSPAVQGI